MNRLNNILSREEYLTAVNEGRFGDFVKKGGNFIKRGIQKVKGAFQLLCRKVKNLIVTFDSNGTVLPVVSPQALGDRFKGEGNVRFFGTESMNREIKEMGGKGCDTNVTPFSENDFKDDSPNGIEFFKWIDDGFKNTNYYKNLQTMNKLVESRKFSSEDILNEKLESDERIRYNGGSVRDNDDNPTGVEAYKTISGERFKKLIRERIDAYCVNQIENKPANLLVFGAPGIGKSTIPNTVVREFNKLKDEKDKISIITVNCSRLESGDLMMPAFPKDVDVVEMIKQSPRYKQAAAALAGLDAKTKASALQGIVNSMQQTANNAPAPWLPCYRKSGNDDADAILDAYANGGLYTMSESEAKEILKQAGADESQVNAGGESVVRDGKDVVKGKTSSTGSGGIILLDEFLRCDPRIFKQLLNFLFERHFEDYYLGSKWFIMACSNRPCDSNEVDKNWIDWEAADRDRWPATVNYAPEPEEWKKWAREKGFDENLLKFIFDESKSSNNLVNGNEYRRWHNMANKQAISNNVKHKDISPRDWEQAMKDFSRFYENHKDEGRFKNGFSTAFMTIEEIRETVDIILGEELTEELISWYEKYCGGLDVEEIIKNPVGVPMPMISKMKEDKEGKVIKSEEKNETLVMEVLMDKLCDRYYDENGEEIKPLTDEELSQIMIWIGINFKDSWNVVGWQFANQLKDKLKVNFWDYHKFGLLFMAAFPEKDYMEVVEYPGLKEVLSDKKHSDKTKYVLPNGQGILDVVKEFANKYFNWRMDGEELLTIYDVKMPEETEEKEE
jgi:hypothetical protein